MNKLIFVAPAFLLVVMGVVAFLLFSNFQITEAMVERSGSVELGISELSPRGHEGGYAMPASVASVPHSCTISVDPASVTVGGSANANVLFDEGNTTRIKWIDRFVDRRPVSGSWTNIWANTTDIEDDQSHTVNAQTSGLAVGSYEYRARGVYIEWDPCKSKKFVKDEGDVCVGGWGTGSKTLSCTDTFEVKPLIPPPPPAPTVDLRISVNGGAFENVASKTVADGDLLNLQWQSTNAVSCTAISGPGFATGGATGDPVPATDSVDTPAPGSNSDFIVECVNSVGVKANDTITVDVPPVVVPPGTVSVTMESQVDGGGYAPANRTVKWDQDVDIRFTTTDANTCTIESGSFNEAIANPIVTSPYTVTDTSITTPAEGASETHRVKCIDTSLNEATSEVVITVEDEPQCSDRKNNDPAEDTLTDATDPGCNPGGVYDPTHDDETDPVVVPNPTATLEISVNGGSWGASLAGPISPTDTIRLQWSSTNAVSCTATAGSGFITGGLPGGIDPVNTPPANGTDTFTVRCVNGVGTPATDTIVVNVNSGIVVGGVPTLTATPDIIRKGETSTLTWDLAGNLPEQCSITKNGIVTELASLGVLVSHPVSPSVTATYLLTCPGGSDDAVVEVLPDIFET